MRQNKNKTRIISDTHFNHKAIKDVFEFRNNNFEYEICRKIRNNVKEGDTLIHLGDVIFDRPSELKEYIKLMGKCTKILVKGNHDKGTDSWYRNQGFNLVVDKLVIGEYVFTHIPIKEELLEKGQINIHGHNHTNREHILYYAKSSANHILYDMIEQNYMPVILNNLIKQQTAKQILIKKTKWQTTVQTISGFIQQKKNWIKTTLSTAKTLITKKYMEMKLKIQMNHILRKHEQNGQ